MRTAPLPSKSAGAVIDSIYRGVSFREFERLAVDLELSPEMLGTRLGMSRATIFRRKAAGRLDRFESDRLLRFQRLYQHAGQVLGSSASGKAWLKSKQHGLGGQTPLIFADTEVGAREVEDLLGRIDYGVYS